MSTNTELILDVEQQKARVDFYYNGALVTQYTLIGGIVTVPAITQDVMADRARCDVQLRNLLAWRDICQEYLPLATEPRSAYSMDFHKEGNGLHLILKIDGVLITDALWDSVNDTILWKKHPEHQHPWADFCNFVDALEYLAQETANF